MNWDQVAMLLFVLATIAGFVAHMDGMGFHVSKTVAKWCELASAVLYAGVAAACFWADLPTGTGVFVIVSAMAFINWWNRGGGDDFRKLKKKAGSVVRAAAGRLTVVPSPQTE